MIGKEILEKLEKAKITNKLFIDFEFTREVFNETLKIDELTNIYLNEEIKKDCFYFIYRRLKGIGKNLVETIFLDEQDSIFKNNSIIHYKHNYSLIFFQKKDNFGYFQYFTSHKDEFIEYFEVYIFGEERIRKIIFQEIKTKFENWLKSHSTIYIESMFFNFKGLKIDYNYLIKLKKEKKNTYLIHHKKRRIPVRDLLEYIGEENIKFEKEKWKGENFLTKIRLESFKILRKINLELSKDINILLAHNGLGKTSILQAITWALLPLMTRPEEKPAFWKKYIRFNQDDARISLFWGNETERIRYFFQEEIQENKYFELPKQILLSYGVSFNTSKFLNHSDIERDLVNGDADFYSTHSIFTDHTERFFDPIILLQDLPTGAKATKKQLPKIHEIMDLIKNTINEYLALVDENGKLQLTGETPHFYFEDFDKNKLQIENLSEGYRDHVLLITDIIVKIIASRKNIFETKEPEISKKLFTNVKGTILIDEFDRHLHPSWQRKFLPKLKQDFPNIQFILTTHNIFSLQSAEGSFVNILTKENNEIVAKGQIIKKGLSIETIYNLFFDGKDQFFSLEIEEKLKKFKAECAKIYDEEININEDFIKLVRELTAENQSEELKALVATEIAQIKYITGQNIEL